MKKILLYTFIIISLTVAIFNSCMSDGHKIDNYEQDTLMGIWAQKFNFAIYNYTGSVDTIIVGTDTLLTWATKLNTFIDSMSLDTITYGVDDFEDYRVKFNNAIDSLDSRSVILKLFAWDISEDSLTYNSTGALVTYVSDNKVVLDDLSEVVIGNSIRFRYPLNGAIYKINDTVGDTLYLNQNCTAIATDEFLWGGVNTWYDESNFANDLYQTTAIRQPKLLWTKTDSSKLYFDGVTDFMYVLNSTQLDISTNNFSIAFSAKLYDQNASRVIMSKGGTGAVGYAILNAGADDRLRSDLDAGVSTFATIRLNYTENKFVISNKRSSFATIATDLNISTTNISAASSSLSNSSTFKIGAAFSSGLIGKFELEYLYIYNRALTDQEIKILSQ